MLPQEVLRQIRRLQLKARRVVEDMLGGEYHSVFKGAGVAFDEVREYQPGDDIRSIDWNVTARMGHPYVKRFVEERELTVLLAVDCSGSQQYGSRLQDKREIAAEMAAVLAFSATSNNDRVGLVQLTDRVEQYIPPRKGGRHVLRLIREILFYQPKQRKTSLRDGLDFLGRILKRRAIIFLFSDFLDEDFERSFKRTGRKHDLIAVHVTDPCEETLPPVGLVEMEDSESGQRLVVDASSSEVALALKEAADERRQTVRQLARSADVDLIEASTSGGHLEALLRFFQMREHHARRGRS